MLDPLSALPVTSWGAGGLLALCVLLILTGRLVPRQQMLDLREDRDKWKATADDLLAAHHELGMSVEKLLTLAETTHHALTEIQELAQRAADEDRSR